jgi:hypothetical protein
MKLTFSFSQIVWLMLRLAVFLFRPLFGMIDLASRFDNDKRKLPLSVPLPTDKVLVKLGPVL